jgi:glycosyltransferase involved in cell wall biosynthesis
MLKRVVMAKNYSVLIRTFNSAKTLPLTLSSLANQTVPPTEYVFVDTGSTDGTLDSIPYGSIIHRYIGTDFNYSEALNQGIKHVSTGYVLIISSHTSLRHATAIDFALELLSSNHEIGAAYFCSEDSAELNYRLIDKKEFDGFNGLWNTCSLIKVPLLQRRNFRAEVFTAEDQEWARWLIYCEGKLTARISGAGLTYNNPRKSSWKSALKKKQNEYVAVAYFSNRTLLGLPNLIRIGITAINPDGYFRVRDRLFHLVLLVRLICCHFVRPRSKSRYF